MSRKERIDLKSSPQRQKFKKMAEEVSVLVGKYADLIGLDDRWRFKVTFKSLKDEAVGTCTAEWHYRIAYLEFDLARLSTKKDHLLEEVVRHEILHIPCWRLMELVQTVAGDHAEYIGKVEEELVTFLEYMPVWDLTRRGDAE